MSSDGIPRRPRAPDPEEARRARIYSDRLHSLIVGIPIIVVLVAVVWYLKSTEDAAKQPLVLTEQQTLAGEFQGVSGTERERYLWLMSDGKRRGVHVLPVQEEALAALEKGRVLQLLAAPREAGTKVLWLVEARDGELILSPPVE